MCMYNAYIRLFLLSHENRKKSICKRDGQKRSRREFSHQKPKKKEYNAKFCTQLRDMNVQFFFENHEFVCVYLLLCRYVCI